MPNVPESTNYDAGIYQLETSDLVQGGENGISNAQAKGLANRTNWLKSRIDALSALLVNATTAVRGIVQLATGDETSAGIVADKAVTPASLLSAMNGAGKQLLATSGYQKLTGGLIIQWGTATEAVTSNFPIPFPNACLSIVTTYKSDAFRSNDAMGTAWIVSNSQFRIRFGPGSDGDSGYWIAVGY